jgi:hypothetical protein
MWGCLFAMFFLGIFFVLAIFSSILNFFGGLWRTTQNLGKDRGYSERSRQREQASWYEESEPSHSDTTSDEKNKQKSASNGKIFQQNEGEYVDFEEVKD